MDTKKPDEPNITTPVTPVEPVSPAVSPAVAPPVSPVVPPVTPVEPVPPATGSVPTVPVVPGEPAAVPAVDDMAGQVKTKSNALMYILIAVLLIILFGLAGLFFYRQFSAATNSEAQINVPTPEAMNSPTIVVPTYSSEEEKDAMGVDVGDVNSQLNIIQEDVNKL